MILCLAVGTGGTGASYSPDGSQIVYTRRSQHNNSYTAAVWSMNSDGSNKTQLANALTDYPSWSPDGTKIVYTSGNPWLGQTDLYLMNPDGTDKVQLTTSSESEYLSRPSLYFQLNPVLSSR